MGLLPEQAATLRRLVEIWRGRRFILVGATAVGCWMDMRWRATADVDVSVACDLDEFPRGLAKHAGWSQGQGEHRWHSPDGVKLDILPAGDRLLDAGRLRWASGSEMNLRGFRLAFDHAVARHDLASKLVVHVAPLHVLVLLKMVSYLDRSHERERDLQDLVHILRDGIPMDDRFTEETTQVEVDLDYAGAFILASRLRSIVDASDRGAASEFLGNLLAAGARSPTWDRMLAIHLRRGSDVDDDEKTADDLRGLWQAYAAGLALPA